MINYEKELINRVEEYSNIPDGIRIDNPDHRIPVGIFYITNRVIKHFVESRKRQGADLKLLVSHIFDTAEHPDYVIENPQHTGEILIAKMIQGEGKAVALPIDIDGRIKSVFFQKECDFDELKNQMIAFGGAAYPSSFLLPESSSLAASLPALQKRSLDSLTRESLAKEKAKVKKKM
jgi:hypothetical protein